MTLRGTFSWLLFLLLAAILAGGGYAYRAYSRGNELLRDRVLAELAERAPHWQIEIDRVRFDWNRSLHLYGVVVRAPDDSVHVAEVPEVVVSVDGEALEREQRVDVRHVHVRRPTVTLVRERDGRWNWQRLFPLESEYRTSYPEWTVEDGTLLVRLENGRPEPAELRAGDVDLTLVPSGKRRFRIGGRIDVNRAGVVDVTGSFDAERQRWAVDGRARDVAAGDSLIELAARAFPEFGVKLAHLDRRLRELLPPERREPQRSPVRVADAVNPVDVGDRPPIVRPISGRRPPGHGFGIGGRLNVAFRVTRGDADDPIGFDAAIDVRGGRLDHPAFPFPLRDVDGHVAWRDSQLELRDVVAHHGVTRLELDGVVRRQGDLTPARFDVRLRDVVLDEHLASRLPDRLRTAFRELQPTGRANLDAVLESDGLGRFVPRDLNVTVRDGTVTYREFPYRIDRVRGTARQEGEELVVAFEGVAGRTPVRVRGFVRDVGPNAHSEFEVTGRGLPIDDAFLAACKPPVRETLRQMHLEADVDFRLDLERLPGPGQPWRSRLAATTRDAAAQFDGFPYRVTKLSGTLTASSEDRVWRFRDLRGVHDTAELSGSGDFVMGDERRPGRLVMRVVARNASFDKQLEMALPDALRSVWRSLSPRGRIDAAIDVDWEPGRPVDVALPIVFVTDGHAKPDAFPYDLDELKLKGSYVDGRVKIVSLSAVHGDTRVRSTGLFEIDPDGRWELSFENLYVDDLAADARFREALPADVRTVVDALDPSGPLSFSGTLRFRGAAEPESPLKASWDVDVVLSGNTIASGVELQNVHGTVSSTGAFDGNSVTSIGELDLESLVVLGYQFTNVKGPFTTNGSQITLGSRKAFESPPPPITLEERITAEAIDGTLVFDGLVVAAEEPSYRLKVLLRNGRLETYARRYLPGTTNLAGIANGRVELHGRGMEAKNLRGHGQVKISPAALYELPVLAQMFKVLSFAPPNRTAFDDARLDFAIAREQFLFEGIELVGDAVNFRGRGTVGFDGRMNLDFYSRMPRRQLPIPIVGFVVGEAAKGMVAIYVRGNVSKPQAQVVTAPTVDAALKSFLGNFAPPGRRPPREQRVPFRTNGTEESRRGAPRRR